MGDFQAVSSGKKKKLRKIIARGEVNTAARRAECVAAGLAPAPTVRMLATATVPGARVPTMGDVASIVHRALGPAASGERRDDGGFFYKEAGTFAEARREWPPWLEVGNGACVGRVVLCFVAGVTDETAKAQPFLAAHGGCAARVFCGRDAASKRDALDAVLAVRPPWDVIAEEDEDAEPTTAAVFESLEALMPFLASRDQLKTNDYPLAQDEAVEDDDDDVFAVAPPEPPTKRARLDADEDCGAPLDSPLPTADHAAAIVLRCSVSGTLLVETRRGSFPGEEQVRVFGLDCEMVTSARGPELARCTLVDEAGEVILDELVKPSVAVTDYCTRWSGLDEKRLRHVTTTLDQCRAAVLQIVRKTDVLVGHSMDNDLRCLRLAHAFCGDTALLYGHARGSGYKRSLRHLSAEFLQRAIQDGAHDSAIDATTALDLFRLKTVMGLSFGEPSQAAALRRRDACLEGIAARGCRVAVISDDVSLLKRVARGAVSAVKVAPANAHNILGNETLKHVAAGWHLLVARVANESAGDEEAFAARVDAQLRALHAALPRDALLIVATQPTLAPLAALERQKVACSDARSVSQWSEAMETQRLDAIDAAMFGTVFCFGPPAEDESSAAAGGGAP